MQLWFRVNKPLYYIRNNANLVNETLAILKCGNFEIILKNIHGF